MAHRFSPSINLNRDAEAELAYFPTANAQRVYLQILNDFALGVHSFSIIGSYGTGKSAFLVAFEQTLRGQHTYFQNPNGHFGEAHEFEFINIVGGYASIGQALAERLGAPAVEEIWSVLNDRHQALHKRNGCLVIAIDEFGKFLEYAAHTNPDKELYFVQQLAEYVNDASKNIVLLVTLHQSFSTYSDGLDRKQREEWEKVKGRLKELTFNEPVEQLLALAAEQLNTDAPVSAADDLTQLVEAIGQSLAFPHRRKLSTEFASRLLPFDLLAASVLTQALQWYGQNERSLFTFLYANDHLGIKSYDQQRHRYYNLVCVYEYLLHNYYSVLSSAHNPHYLQWGAIRNAIERVEAMLTEHISEALSLVKLIGLLNIFAPQGAKINERFLMDYARITLGIQNVATVLDRLETHKIVRYVRFKDAFVLFEGTDLNIELALLEANGKVEPIGDVTTLLRKYFAFPIVLAKAVSYQTGAPRFFEYRLSPEPLATPSDGLADGAINLVFGETLDLDTLLDFSQTHAPTTLYGWYRYTGQIREILYEIEKINYVSNANSDDRVAVRELRRLKSHQVDRLNQQVLQGMYATDQPVIWVWNGNTVPVTGPADLNRLLSKICQAAYNQTPIFRNELVNRQTVSSAIATARKVYFRALVDRWTEEDLGFERSKFPAEKTIYLTLLQATGIHRIVDQLYTLDGPTERSFLPLWQCCEYFLERAKLTPKSVSDLADELRRAPFGLKQGFIEFWVPTFLFVRRESFALYFEGQFRPEISADTLELIRISPHKFQIKSFNVDGIKLRFFNRCRVLLRQQEASNVTKSDFIETIKPFLVFYNGLPTYAKRTQRLAEPTLRLREAIANARDPEKAFFEDFPAALGYPHIADEQTSDPELEAYVVQLRESVHELQSCFDHLLDRIEAQLREVLGLAGAAFPDYKTSIAGRFENLRTYLLLPKQKTLYLRLTSALEDRNTWLGSVVQAILGQNVQLMTDEDELALYARLQEAIQELDNLCELDELTLDPEQDPGAVRVEITTYGQESRKLVHRLPRQKEDAAATLYTELKDRLTGDGMVQVAVLIRLLQETITNGEN